MIWRDNPSFYSAITHADILSTFQPNVATQMRYEDIDCDLKEISFKFFYRFSRFEFCLKNNGFHSGRHKNPSAKRPVSLKADWDKFIVEFFDNYKISTPDSSAELKNLSPKRQMICPDKGICWMEISHDSSCNELCTTVRMLKSVRNNLFHGGKGWDEETDGAERNKNLLCAGIKVLDDLAKLAKFDDYYI